MSHPRGYVDAQYLQAAAKLFVPIKQRSYALMHISPHQSVLDVGCGPGLDTVQLAQFVGEKGLVIGVDLDKDMLEEADERAKKAEVNHIVKHKLSDASSLALNSSSFDSCRSERLFLHLQDPSQVLAEMVRVTKPEGWIVVVDTDAATVSFDTVETDIERRLLRFRAEQLLNNGYAGRQLYRLFRQCDLVDISVEMFPLFINKYATARYIAGLDETEKEAIKMGIITREELIRWHQDLESSAKKQVFFASASVVMVAARKP